MSERDLKLLLEDIEIKNKVIKIRSAWKWLLSDYF